jgi:hypothetical protein
LRGLQESYIFDSEMQKPSVRLKILMLERGMKPEDIAVGTGLTKGYVYNVLTERIVTRAGRKKIENFLGVSVWPESERHRAMGAEETQAALAGGIGSPRSADGALNNLHPEWGELMGRLGFTVATVSFPHSDRLFKHQGFEEKLGMDLQAADLGQYDSTIWENPRLHFFLLHTKALRAALELVQSRLAALDLLTGCRIGYMDSADKVWRTVFPSIEETPAPQA